MPVDTGSVLDTVKKSLNIDSEFDAFDVDLVLYINSVFGTLHQLGVGTPYFTITDRDDQWSDFIQPQTNLEAVKTYISLKVKLIFDPPQTAPLIAAIEKMCAELEWRLNVQVETEALNANPA